MNRLLPLFFLSFVFQAFAGEKPNIVYVICDDLGYGDIQCLNPKNGKIPTPHVDKLASEGMTFTDAHSGSSVCTPTRYGLLTGRYSWRTKLPVLSTATLWVVCQVYLSGSLAQS